MVEAICARTVPTATPTFPPPIYYPTPTFDPTLPTSTPMPPPSPEPSPTDTPWPTLTPTVTATLMPPPPDRITPRPADRPFTPVPRPKLPSGSAVKLGADGCYVARVGGCVWLESGRFDDPLTGDEIVVMQTPCLPYEGLHFKPKTRSMDYFIQ